MVSIARASRVPCRAKSIAELIMPRVLVATALPLTLADLYQHPTYSIRMEHLSLHREDAISRFEAFESILKIDNINLE